MIAQIGPGVCKGRYDSDAVTVTNEDLKKCGSKMNITFPMSTRGLNINKVTGGPDDALNLKIEIDRKNLDALIKNSPFASVELRSDRRFV